MNKSEKSITVINWSGLNYGDNEIFRICYNLFFKNKYEKINLIADYPEKFSDYPKVNLLCKVFGIKKNWLKVIKAVWNSDKVFCGGGDIIVGDIGTSLLLVLAALLKKDIIIAGVGVLPIKSKKKFALIIKEKMQRYFLNRSKLICVRDENSQNILKLYTDNDICVYPDLCFLYECDKYKKNLFEINNNKIGIEFSDNEKYAAFSIIPPSKMYNNNWGQEEYKMLAKLLDKIIVENEITPIFLPGVSKKDLSKVNYNILSDDDVYKMIISEMENKDKVIIVSETLSIDEISFILKKCDFAMLSRLHFIITAIISRTPFLALNYSSKINNILKGVKLEKYLLEWPVSNLDKLYNKIIEINKSKNASSDINDKMNIFGKKVADLYDKLDGFL